MHPDNNEKSELFKNKAILEGFVFWMISYTRGTEKTRNKYQKIGKFGMLHKFLIIGIKKFEKNVKKVCSYQNNV